MASFWEDDIEVDAAPSSPNEDINLQTRSRFAAKPENSPQVSLDGSPYTKYISMMPPLLKEDNFDILVLHTEGDIAEAKKMQHRIQTYSIFSMANGRRNPVVLLENDFVGDNNPVHHLDCAFSKALFIFLFVTGDFCNQQKDHLFKSHSCLMESVNERRWCVIPVYTERKATREKKRYKLPMLLKALKGVNYWDASLFEKSVCKLLEMKADERALMDKELDDARRSFYEDQKKLQEKALRHNSVQRVVSVGEERSVQTDGIGFQTESHGSQETGFSSQILPNFPQNLLPVQESHFSFSSAVESVYNQCADVPALPVDCRQPGPSCLFQGHGAELPSEPTSDRSLSGPTTSFTAIEVDVPTFGANYRSLDNPSQFKLPGGLTELTNKSSEVVGNTDLRAMELGAGTWTANLVNADLRGAGLGQVGAGNSTANIPDSGMGRSVVSQSPPEPANLQAARLGLHENVTTSPAVTEEGMGSLSSQTEVKGSTEEKLQCRTDTSSTSCGTASSEDTQSAVRENHVHHHHHTHVTFNIDRVQQMAVGENAKITNGAGCRDKENQAESDSDSDNGNNEDEDDNDDIDNGDEAKPQKNSEKKSMDNECQPQAERTSGGIEIQMPQADEEETLAKVPMDSLQITGTCPMGFPECPNPASLSTEYGY